MFQHLPALGLLLLAGINVIKELTYSTTAAHRSRTEKAFITTVWLSIKLCAVFSSNVSENCNCSKSCIVIFLFDNHLGEKAH